MNRILTEKYNEMLQNNHYMDAIEREDKVQLRQLVSSRQQETGYTPGYWSGSLGDRGSVYRRAESNGIWATQHKESAETYTQMGGNVGGQLRKLAVKYNNPLDLKHLGIQTSVQIIKQELVKRGVNLPDYYYETFAQEAIDEQQDTWFTYAIIDGTDWKKDRALALKAIMDAGYDSIILADTHYGVQSDSLVLFHSHQAKLDNLVTVNDNNIIPLWQRFDETNEDVRF